MKLLETVRTPETELNFELYFVTEVLKLRSLHYGYWDDPPIIDSVDLGAMKRAQARFTEKLLELVPPDVKTVLDVGAGIGDNACALSRAGHRVTAISPDRNHERYFEAFDDPNVAFQRTTFEDFVSADRFDLVLFSESHNYFDLRWGLERARDLLRPGGSLLVSGMFRRADKSPFPPDFDLSSHAYVQSAVEHGFLPVHIADITANVLPTIEMIDRAVTEILEPTLRFAELYATARAPWKTRVLRLLLPREHTEGRRIVKKIRRKTNPTHFRERFRYATMLFQTSELGT